MPTKPDHELYEHYRTKDALVRAFITAHYVALRAQQVAVAGLREALQATTNLTEVDIAGLIASMEAKAGRAANQVTDEELHRQLLDVVAPMASNRVQRRRDQSVRDKKEKVFSASLPGVLKARKARKFVIFAEQTVTATVGAVLMGPAPLVARALPAVEAGLGHPSRFRTVWLRDRARDGMLDREPGLTTVYTPWWDHAITHFQQFRKLVAGVEDGLGGQLDLLLCDDLARTPKQATMAKGVPHNFMDRAVWVFDWLVEMMRNKGGAVVAGLKLREGEKYDQHAVARLSEKCQLYNLYEEGGLLYAQDGYGNPHLIAETGANRETECRSSKTTSSAA